MRTASSRTSVPLAPVLGLLSPGPEGSSQDGLVSSRLARRRGVLPWQAARRRRHVDDEIPTSCPIHVREVRRLGFELLHYGLEVLSETPVLNGCIGLLCGHAGTNHEAHTLTPPLSRFSSEAG